MPAPVLAPATSLPPGGARRRHLSTDAARHGLDALTDREREITVLVATGLSNDEIAARLVLSPATVKTHVNRAMTKVGARDRAQLVVFAHRVKLIRS